MVHDARSLRLLFVNKRSGRVSVREGAGYGPSLLGKKDRRKEGGKDDRKKRRKKRSKEQRTETKKERKQKRKKRAQEGKE